MKVGDKVMCVDANWAGDKYWGATRKPVLGGVYIVRNVRHYDYGCGIALAGMENPINPGTGNEFNFFAFHFRKLDDIPDRVNIKQHSEVKG